MRLSRALLGFSLVLGAPFLINVWDDFFEKLNLFFGPEQALVFILSLAVYAAFAIYNGGERKFE